MEKLQGYSILKLDSIILGTNLYQTWKNEGKEGNEIEQHADAARGRTLDYFLSIFEEGTENNREIDYQQRQGLKKKHQESLPQETEKSIYSFLSVTEPFDLNLWLYRLGYNIFHMKQDDFKMPQGFQSMVRRLPGEGSSSSQEQPSEEESFQPEYHQIKKMGLKPSKKKLRVGGWSSKENAVYLEFMRNNISDFTTEKARRTTKVFFRLSKILKKRTPDQCRSHHQKLQMKHKDDIYEIMNEVQIKINKTIAQEFVSRQIHLQYSNSFPKKELRPLPRTAPSEGDGTGREMDGWYRIRVQGSSIRVEIKTSQIETWNPY